MITFVIISDEVGVVVVINFRGVVVSVVSPGVVIASSSNLLELIVSMTNRTMLEMSSRMQIKA
jgi:hypothetical protein